MEGRIPLSMFGSSVSLALSPNNDRRTALPSDHEEKEDALTTAFMTYLSGTGVSLTGRRTRRNGRVTNQ